MCAVMITRRPARQTEVMKCDIAVIGAGAIGLSTALHGARRGRSVVLVERATAGSQASGRAAGLFKSVQADELRTRIARRGIAAAISFGDWAGEPLPVCRSGSYLVARTGQHAQYLKAEAAQSRGWGVDVREATPGQLADDVGYYHGSGQELALWCPEDIYIDEPGSLVQALLAAARRHGVQVLEGEAAQTVTLSAGRVAGLDTSARTITAPIVVDAAGAWTRQLAERAGSRVALAAVRHQLLVTEPAPEADPAAPICRIVDAAVYLRPNRGGLMVGGFEADPLALDPQDQPPWFSTDDVPLDRAVLELLAALVAQQVPLATAEVAELRGGLFTMSPDGRFVAGPVPDVPGLWVASGCNGSGFSSALALGEAVADWITSQDQRLDITDLAPGRFGPFTQEELVKAGAWQYAHYYDPPSPI
jgi:glycine/D-amino acid oxidase-like deaminating enzyme